MTWMDPETLRRLARELYRAADRNGRDGTDDGRLIARFCATIASDYHGRAIRVEQSELRAAHEALRAPTVELPIIAPRTGARVRRYVGEGVTIEYRERA